MSAVLAQEVEHRRGKEEVPSSNLGNGLVNNLVKKNSRDGQKDDPFL